jgi:hypothetical protein
MNVDLKADALVTSGMYSSAIGGHGLDATLISRAENDNVVWLKASRRMKGSGPGGRRV